MNDFIDAIMKVAEHEVFRNWKDEGKIENATLIMHPRYKWIFTHFKLDVDVLFSDVCPKDKIYMVNDEHIKNEIKRDRAYFYRESDNNDKRD